MELTKVSKHLTISIFSEESAKAEAVETAFKKTFKFNSRVNSIRRNRLSVSINSDKNALKGRGMRKNSGATNLNMDLTHETTSQNDDTVQY
jgi:hypothetical protein